MVFFVLTFRPQNGLTAISNDPIHPPVSDGHTPQLCILVRTYPKQFDYILISILSYFGVTDMSHPLVYIMNTEKSATKGDKRKLMSIINLGNQIIGHSVFSFLDLSIENSNDYGYSLTDRAIDLLMSSSKCEYFLITNGDNLYSKDFLVGYIYPHMIDRTDMIGISFISHHKWHPESKDGIHYSDGTKIPMHGEFALNHIDLGACVFSRNVFQNTSDRFIPISAGDYWRADGLFITKMSQKFTKLALRREFLMFHQ